MSFQKKSGKEGIVSKGNWGPKGIVGSGTYPKKGGWREEERGGWRRVEEGGERGRKEREKNSATKTYRGEFRDVRGKNLKIFVRLNQFSAPGNKKFPLLEQREEGRLDFDGGQVNVFDHNPKALANSLREVRRGARKEREERRGGRRER
jgi:hypothetical protein